MCQNDTEHEYEGMEQSLDFVLEYMRIHGPFDGLMGFSQVSPARLHFLSATSVCVRDNTYLLACC